MAIQKQQAIITLGVIFTTISPNLGEAQLIGSGEVLEWQSPPPDHRRSLQRARQESSPGIDAAHVG